MLRKTKNGLSFILMLVLSLLLLRTLYLNINTYDKLTRPLPLDNSLLVDSTATPSDQNNQKKASQGMEFPKDEGEHHNLLNEWWYFSSHLEDDRDPTNKFGITLVFFKKNKRLLFNLTDGVNQKNFSSVINLDSYDILGRDRLMLKKGDFQWLEVEPFKYQINFRYRDKEFNLDLVALKPPFIILNNDDSFYYTQTRLEVTGDLLLGPESYYKIRGTGWINHEGFKETSSWKSWRWYNLQLNNGIEIALTSHLVSREGTFYDKGDLFIFREEREIIEGQKYFIRDLEYWEDARTKIHYPIKWQIWIPESKIDLIATSIIPDQVIDGSHGIYEGTYEVEGIFEGQSVVGRAQFELKP